MLTINEQLELVLETTHLGFWTWNPLTGATSYSPGWLELLGYAADEVADHHALIHPDDRPRRDERMSAYLEGRASTFATVLRVRSRGGGWVLIASRGAVSERDEQGRATRFCGVYEDISALREASTLQASRLNACVLSTLSHKLRNPLNAILGLSEALADRVFGPITPRQRRSLRTIHQSGDRLLAILNDVIEFSRLEAGQLSAELAPASVAACARECLLKLSGVAEERAIGLVAAPLDEAIAAADPRRLRRALESLLRHAFTAAPRGSEVRVRVQRGVDRSWVELIVSGEASGHEPERAGAIELSFDLDAYMGEGACGLALPVAKRLVELQGGDFSVRGVDGRVELRVALPAYDGELGLDPRSPAPASAAAPDRSTRAGAPVILVVEDDDASALLVCEYLEANGLRARLVQDGRAAVEAGMDDEVALVLMDHGLPGMTGLEAATQIRARERTGGRAAKPVILLTGDNSDATRRACAEVGASRLLVKPLPLRELVAAIASLLPGGGRS